MNNFIKPILIGAVAYIVSYIVFYFLLGWIGSFWISTVGMVLLPVGIASYVGARFAEKSPRENRIMVGMLSALVGFVTATLLAKLGFFFILVTATAVVVSGIAAAVGAGSSE